MHEKKCSACLTDFKDDFFCQFVFSENFYIRAIRKILSEIGMEFSERAVIHQPAGARKAIRKYYLSVPGFQLTNLTYELQKRYLFRELLKMRQICPKCLNQEFEPAVSWINFFIHK